LGGGVVAVLVPHFDLPFRFFGTNAVVVEQDSLDDVGNCVEAILLTHVGSRPEEPTFGIPELTFMTQPIGSDFVREIISSQEPRAEVAMTEAPDRFDELIDRVIINLTTRGGGE
jgi:phage baseplate assembly protein W